jgi:predicted ATP-grasp superfamily ATP-dependent carboligase
MAAGRVLITDAEERSVVAAVRGLGRAGYEVTATSSQRPAAGFWSLAAKQRLRLPDAREDQVGFVERLEATLERHRHDVLLPGTEASLLAVSAGRERLERLTHLGLPPHEVVERSLDKDALMAAAAANGIASPRGTVSRDRAELDATVSDFGFPFVLKPQRSLVSTEDVLRHCGSVLVSDEQELEKRIGQFGFPVIVQHAERGAPVYSFGGVYAGGRLLAVAFARYFRTWPPEAGSASYAETRSIDPALTEQVASLIREVGWEGIFELELLQLEDGRFAAIDFNPRVYGSLSLAQKAGANLPAIWCDWVRTGEARSGVVIARPGVRYRLENAELRNLFSLLARARLGEALGIGRPRRDTVHAYFSWDDPGPIVAHGVELAKHGREQWAVSRRSAASRPGSTQMSRPGKMGGIVSAGIQFLLAYLVAAPFVLLARVLRSIKWRVLGRRSASVA